MNNNNETQIHTFGCRLNSLESDIIREKLEANPIQNTIVVNTCAVTREAERQARQKVRQYRRQNPNAHIIVTGCSAQLNPQEWEAMDEVDVILGNKEKLEAKTYQNLAHGSALESKKLVSDILSSDPVEFNEIEGPQNKTRAYLQIQQGCDHRCTFCIIPFTRGPSRSTPLGVMVKQVEKWLDQGYKEVTITGVDITSYGHDLPGQPTLGATIKRLLKLLPGLERLRLSSIDPMEVDPCLLELIKNEKRLMPHIHLSLQSGDNLILKRMKRRHLREDAIALCQDIKKARPEVTFGVDIIAGFPTESEEMFENSKRCLEECGITFVHAFPFSERPGVPASRMPPVEKNMRKVRTQILREYGQKAVASHYRGKINQIDTVLVEQDNKGRCKDYSQIKLKGENISPNSLIKAKIIDVENNILIGEPIYDV